MTTPLHITVTTSGERLDKHLAEALPSYSRAQLQQWIKAGQVKVNDSSAGLKAGTKPHAGDVIVVEFPHEEDFRPQPEDIPLKIIYEDDDLAVIDKPAGLVVHPGAGNPTGTLVNALLSRYPQMQNMDDDENLDEGRAGIVHRLDKDTSGLIVVAKHKEALTELMQQFRDRTVEKTYVALLERTPRTLTGIVDAPIARDPKFRQKMSVIARGRDAITEFAVTDHNFPGGQVLVTLTPRTGRTHQIRVHMAFIGCPIAGDTVYGLRRKMPGLNRHFLHAAALSFDHPTTGERLSFTSPLPPELVSVLERLREKA
jgi:23S rRNA pseudouridine1911/1915/1917 synthase